MKTNKTKMNTEELKTLYNHTLRNSKNFLTPKILKVKIGKNRVVELSAGEPFLTKYNIYGVTFRTAEELQTNKVTNNKSKLLYSYSEALSYYKSL